MKLWRCLFLAILCCACSHYEEAQESLMPPDDESDNGTPVVRILAFGNSFAIDAMESGLYDIAQASGIRLVLGNACQGGFSLQNHWNAFVTNYSGMEYRKCVNRHYSVYKGCNLKAILANEKWDIITFQQVSYQAGFYGTYEPYLTNLINYVKDNARNPNAKYGFYMVWAYAQNASHEKYYLYNNDQMTMYNCIAAATNKAIEAHPELDYLIPTGTAIQNARTTSLGNDLTRDGIHLSEDIGRSIAAYSWLATLFGTETMMKNTFVPHNLDEKTIQLIKNAVLSAIENPYSITPQPGSN